MKAKELVEILLKYPEFEVYGWGVVDDEEYAKVEKRSVRIDEKREEIFIDGADF